MIKKVLNKSSIKQSVLKCKQRSESLIQIVGLILLTMAWGSKVFATTTGNVYCTTQAQVDALGQVDTITGYLYLNGAGILNTDSLHKVKKVYQYVTIVNTALTNVDGLSSLDSVGRYLDFNQNYSLLNFNGLSSLKHVNEYFRSYRSRGLTSTSGLNNLSYVGGYVQIFDNRLLPNLDGLLGLDTIRGNLSIQNNNVLVNLDGLGNVKKIEGGLTLSSNAALTNLNGLRNVTKIEGGLALTSNTSLLNVNGLSNLTGTLDGNLNFQTNNALTNIDSLSGLDSIAGQVYFYQNTALINVDGLKNVTGITNRIYFYNNDKLVNVDGLKNISSMNGEINFYHNAILANLDGLGSLGPNATVSNLYIRDNGGLLNIDSMEGITTISGYIYIYSNAALINLDGLSNVTSIGAYIVVTRNRVLASISGLAGISHADYVEISYNGGLLSLDGINVKSLDRSLTINSNAKITNLNSLSNLKDTIKSLNISSNAMLVDMDSLSGITRVNGNLTIYNNDKLVDLNGLQNIMSMNGNLNISHNLILNDFDGIANIGDRVVHVDIQDNAGLTDITALSNLDTIWGHFYLLRNHALTTLSGMENVKYINDYFSLYDNHALLHIQDLQKLNHIGGYLRIRENDVLQHVNVLSRLSGTIGGYLEIYNNRGLKNIDSLSGVTNVIGYVYIYNNDSLVNLGGLQNITTINGHLTIDNNFKITDLAEISNITNGISHLTINNNNNLNSIAALSGITAITGNLTINNNDSLPDLNGLHSITSMNGQLHIGHNYKIKNLDEFGGLTGNVTNLIINDNNQLENIDSLHLLTKITRLAFNNNDSVTDLKGLQNITSYNNGQLEIQNNLKLENVDHLGNMTGPVGHAYISNNLALENIDSFSGLDFNNRIYFNNNDLVENLDGFSGSVGSSSHYIEIDNNLRLKNIEGLSGLTSVNRVYIRNNDSITDIKGIDNIITFSGTHIYIQNNKLLNSCYYSNICGRLSTNYNQTHISGNDCGCADKVEVQAICTQQAPVGLVTDFPLWLKADTGVQKSGTSVTGWNDASTHGNHASSVLGTNPEFVQVYDNYNPTVNFNDNGGLQGVFTSNIKEKAQGLSVLVVADLETTEGDNPSLFTVSKDALNDDGDSSTSALLTRTNASTIGMLRMNQTKLDQADATVANSFSSIYSTVVKDSFADMYINGIATSSVENPNFLGDTIEVNKFGISSRLGSSPNQFLNGNISEVIMYDTSLLPSHVTQMNSYLAIKYGITLSINYISSCNDVIYDVSTYGKNVIGLGSDDRTGLRQKQSHQKDDSTRLYLSTLVASNSVKTADFQGLQYLLMGHDSGALRTSESMEFPTGKNIVSRLGREWKVTNTGFDEVFSMDVKLVNTVIKNTADLRLIVDSDDGDFSNADTVAATFAYNGNLLTISGIDREIIPLNTTRYITVISLTDSSLVKLIGPGGISKDLSLWLKANRGVKTAGTQVSEWTNNVPVGMTSQATKTATSNVAFKNVGLNFNPTVTFDGTATQSLKGEFEEVSAKPSLFFVVAKNNTVQPGANPVSQSPPGAAGVFQGAGGKYGLDGNGVTCENSPSPGTAPALIRVSYASQNNQMNGYSAINGKASTNCGNGVVNSPDGSFDIGGRVGGLVYNGDISEVIQYNTNTTTIDDIDKVETYLALKYGITLHHNYVSRNGTVIWDTTAMMGYNTAIAGIGYDSLADVWQKQSKSSNMNTILAIGIDSIAMSNAGNGSAFNTDSSYFMWGNNNAGLATQGTNMPATLSSCDTRLAREWKVRLNNFSNTLGLNIDLSSVTHSGTDTGDFKLFVDADGDGDFSTGTIRTYTSEKYSSNVVSFMNVTLSDGEVFTMSTSISSNSIKVVSSGSVDTAAVGCVQGDWTYYHNTNDPTSRLFAIKKNGNTFGASIEITALPNSTTSGYVLRENVPNKQAVFVMGRYATVNLTSGSMDSTKPVCVRFYYDTAEWNAIRDASRIKAAGWSESPNGPAWFKTVGYDLDTNTHILSDRIMPAPLELTPTLGIEKGKPYAEFCGITSFSTFGAAAAVNAPGFLPVELIRFDVHKQGKDAMLQWVTASEVNNSHFEIERSFDGVNFMYLGKVQGAGNSNTILNYRFLDDQLPEMNGVVYYRLKQVDFNNTSNYSNIRSLNLQKSELGTRIDIYPNPSDGSFKLALTQKSPGNINIEIIDLLGKSVYAKHMLTEIGYHIHNLDLKHLVAGTYLMRVSSISSYEQFKLIIK